MSSAPAYFEAIRQKSASRWNQLEADAELAGPWHQLFKQVQSPRHILSELLQNADDAGATEAAVRVEDGVFLFEHNGEDFREEHFASLCRFGYSNKRALHTIGFRGIGFKSIFSLGDCVELFTPTLAVAFQRRRFTEPRWIGSDQVRGSRTQIRVAISDRLLQLEVERNLADWRESPVSLLFFTNIRRLQIGGHDLKWEMMGPGPVLDSVRMALNGEHKESYLLVTSKAETFPADALEEIRQERMIDMEEHGAFPPSSVQVVLGATGRLYVVLPTGVETALPFACNAPFVQDPARLKIKDPETSPTNRWLLERCGTLAASAMLGWLSEDGTSQEERAQAYGLLPDVDRESSSLEGACAAIVELAFDEAIAGRDVLLSETGELRRVNECVVIPRQIYDVWSPLQVASQLDKLGRPSLSVHVAASDRQKLRSWRMVDEIDKTAILAVLKERQLPKPESWPQLLSLWAYIAPEMTGYRHFHEVDKLKVVPASASDVLFSSSEVVRLDSSHRLQADGDWEFIRDLVTVVDQDWFDYLALQRAKLKEVSREQGADALAAADAVLVKLGLASPSDMNSIFVRVAAAFFSPGSRTLNDCVRIGHIAARASASVTPTFQFVTRDGYRRPPSNALYFDADGSLDSLLPESQHGSQILHPKYSETFTSCSREEWSTWSQSLLSGLLTAPRIVATEKKVWSSKAFIETIRKIAPGARQIAFPYTSNRSYTYQFYTLFDSDFEADCVAHWNSQPDEGNLWGKVVELIAASPSLAWSGHLLLKGQQSSTNGQSIASVDFGAIPAAWVRRLREIPCLPDTRGSYRRPDDLLRRTPETEALMGVEPFLDHRLDRPAIYPLLDALGVRRTASGPKRLLDALRALSQTASPPVAEVDKWYRRLDQFVETCSTLHFQTVQSALLVERLIFTQDGDWTTANAAYLSSGDDDVPELAIVRTSVADLSFWRRIGVAERPTVERAIAWLGSLASGSALAGADLRRVRGLLARYPVRVWLECGHWLNLQGEWSPIGALKYALTMQSLVPWGHLFPWVKQQTADLQRLSGETTREDVFAHLHLLAACVEERMENQSLFASRRESTEWLRVFGIELLRIELDTDEETQRVRDLATRVATTKWIESRGLEIIPFIGGTPAGTARSADVVWIDDKLHVEAQSRAKLAKRVPEELAKPFNRQDVRSALDYCFERAVDDVRDYLRENFALTHVESSKEGYSSNDPNAYEDISDIAPAVTATHSVPLDDTDVDVEDEVPEESAATISNAIVDRENEGHADAHPPVTQDERRATRSKESTTQERPSLVERFAAKHGFHKNGTGGFTATNGERFIRTTASAFGWEHYAHDGALLRSYYAREHCLEQEPLELDTEVWGLLEKFPATYSLLVLDVDAEPVEMSGVELCALRDSKRITLYPAAYRLVMEDPNHA